MKRATIFSFGYFVVRLLGMGKSKIASDGNDAAQFWIELLDAPKINVGEPLGTQLAPLDPARKLRNGGIGDVFIVGGKRPGIGRRTNKTVSLRRCGRIGHSRNVAGKWRECGFEWNGARTGTAFIEGGHIDAPGARGLRQ